MIRDEERGQAGPKPPLFPRGTICHYPQLPSPDSAGGSQQRGRPRRFDSARMQTANAAIDRKFARFRYSIPRRG